MEQYVYLALNLFSIAFPLSRSFEDKLTFYRSWKYLFPAILLSGAFMIAWDIWFTQIGIWAFNPKYVLGWYIWGLPIEEWLFFVNIPFACAFIYECVVYFFKPSVWRKSAYFVAWVLVFALALMAYYHNNLWYTGAKLGVTSVVLAIHLLIFGNRIIGRLLLAYLFTLIPFLVVNGFLTWLPVVTYNNSENLGIRISQLLHVPFFNIPVEDTMYSLLMLLLNISLFEYFRQSLNKKT